jgi:hypothetical protein
MSKLKDFSIAVFFLGALATVVVLAWDFHQRSAQLKWTIDSVNGEIAAYKKANGSGNLSTVLSEAAGAAREQRSYYKAIGKEANIVFDWVGELIGDPKKPVPKSGTARAVFSNLSKSMSGVDDLVASSKNAVDRNSEAAQKLLADASSMIGPTGPVGLAIDEVRRTAANAAGAIGSSGSSGTFIDVESKLAEMIGEKGQTGSIAHAVSEVDRTTTTVSEAADEGKKALDDIIHGKNTPLFQRVVGTAVGKMLSPAVEWIWNRFTTLRVKQVNQP